MNHFLWFDVDVNLIIHSYFLEPELDDVLEVEIVCEEAACEINIDDLPFYCKLIILSKLDTQDICHLSMTSRHWREVCSDQFLWRELLYRDMLKWHSVGYRSYPLTSLKEFCDLMGEKAHLNNGLDSETYSAYDLHARLSCKDNINFKALYFHSAYQRHQDVQLIGVVSSPNADKEYDVNEENSLSAPTDQQLASNQSFQRFLRNLWMRMRSGDGEVIMLGPGMESPNTSKIFRRLMWARPDLLITQRLLPGSQDGVGSGVEVDFKGEKRFNLIALYSGNHRERRKRFGIERLLQSNIIEPVLNDEDAENALESSSRLQTAGAPQSVTKFKLRELVVNFLQHRVDTYRLIYVVDATKIDQLSQLACNRHELQALIEGIRSFEDEAVTVRQRAREEQRHAGGEHAASAFSSIINFTAAAAAASSESNTPRRPLLVLSCVKDKLAERLPCVEIASLLDLAAITDRPWHVQDVTVNNLNGLESGLEWLFKQP